MFKYFLLLKILGLFFFLPTVGNKTMQEKKPIVLIWHIVHILNGLSRTGKVNTNDI